MAMVSDPSDLAGDSLPEFDLPGFRFHPTEEELLGFYLKNMIFDKKLRCDIIGFLNIYHHDPWELPGLAKIGEREWYFFVPRDRKHGSGGRPNRTTENGFWKATGSDRRIISLTDPKRAIIGLRKTLVFYKGRAPRGSKTDWVMNEYRLPDNCSAPKDIVLCKIYRKATSLKVLEQRAAMEEETKSPLQSMDPLFFSLQQNQGQPIPVHHVSLKQEFEEAEQKLDITAENIEGGSSSSSSLVLGSGMEMGQLQVPEYNNDWMTQDPLWNLLRSPWLDNMMMPCANILNF